MKINGCQSHLADFVAKKKPCNEYSLTEFLNYSNCLELKRTELCLIEIFCGLCLIADQDDDTLLFKVIQTCFGKLLGKCNFASIHNYRKK